jgi:hypothetical protein
MVDAWAVSKRPHPRKDRLAAELQFTEFTPFSLGMIPPCFPVTQRPRKAKALEAD